MEPSSQSPSYVNTMAQDRQLLLMFMAPRLSGKTTYMMELDGATYDITADVADRLNCHHKVPINVVLRSLGVIIPETSTTPSFDNVPINGLTLLQRITMREGISDEEVLLLLLFHPQLSGPSLAANIDEREIQERISVLEACVKGQLAVSESVQDAFFSVVQEILQEGEMITTSSITLEISEVKDELFDASVSELRRCLSFPGAGASKRNMVLCWEPPAQTHRAYSKALNVVASDHLMRTVQYIRWGYEIPAVDLRELIRRSVRRFLVTGLYVPAMEIFESLSQTMKILAHVRHGTLTGLPSMFSSYSTATSAQLAQLVAQDSVKKNNDDDDDDDDDGENDDIIDNMHESLPILKRRRRSQRQSKERTSSRERDDVLSKMKKCQSLVFKANIGDVMLWLCAAATSSKVDAAGIVNNYNILRPLTSKLRTLLCPHTSSLIMNEWDSKFVHLLTCCITRAYADACWPRIIKDTILCDLGRTPPYDGSCGPVAKLWADCILLIDLVSYNDSYGVSQLLTQRNQSAAKDNGLYFLPPSPFRKKDLNDEASSSTSTFSKEATMAPNPQILSTSLLHIVSDQPPMWSLLHHAAASLTPTTEVVSLLVSRGLSLGTVDSRGCTALHVAASILNCAAIETLIAHGSSVSKRDNEGKTPLHTFLLSIATANHSFYRRFPSHKLLAIIISLLGELSTIWSHNPSTLKSLDNLFVLSIIYTDDIVAKGVINLASSCPSTLWDSRSVRRAALLAVKGRRLKVVECLIESFRQCLVGDDVCNDNDSAPTITEEGDSQDTGMMIDANVKCSIRDFRMQLLYVALRTGSVSIVGLLLNNGFSLWDLQSRCPTSFSDNTTKSLTSYEKDYNILLQAAVLKGNVTILQMLLKSQRQTSSLHLISNSALARVLFSSFSHHIPWLIHEERNGHIELPRNEALSDQLPLQLLSPLCLACLSANADVLKTLLATNSRKLTAADCLESPMSPIVGCCITGNLQALVALKRQMGESEFGKACLYADAGGFVPLRILFQILSSQTTHPRFLSKMKSKKRSISSCIKLDEGNFVAIFELLVDAVQVEQKKIFASQSLTRQIQLSNSNRNMHLSPLNQIMPGTNATPNDAFMRSCSNAIETRLDILRSKLDVNLSLLKSKALQPQLIVQTSEYMRASNARWDVIKSLITEVKTFVPSIRTLMQSEILDRNWNNLAQCILLAFDPQSSGAIKAEHAIWGKLKERIIGSSGSRSSRVTERIKKFANDLMSYSYPLRTLASAITDSEPQSGQLYQSSSSTKNSNEQQQLLVLEFELWRRIVASSQTPLANSTGKSFSKLRSDAIKRGKHVSSHLLASLKALFLWVEAIVEDGRFLFSGSQTSSDKEETDIENKLLAMKTVYLQDQIYRLESIFDKVSQSNVVPSPYLVSNSSISYIQLLDILLGGERNSEMQEHLDTILDMLRVGIQNYVVDGVITSDQPLAVLLDAGDAGHMVGGNKSRYRTKDPESLAESMAGRIIAQRHKFNHPESTKIYLGDNRWPICPLMSFCARGQWDTALTLLQAWIDDGVDITDSFRFVAYSSITHLMATCKSELAFGTTSSNRNGISTVSATDFASIDAAHVVTVTPLHLAVDANNKSFVTLILQSYPLFKVEASLISYASYTGRTHMAALISTQASVISVPPLFVFPEIQLDHTLSSYSLRQKAYKPISSLGLADSHVTSVIKEALLSQSRSLSKIFAERALEPSDIPWSAAQSFYFAGNTQALATTARYLGLEPQFRGPLQGLFVVKARKNDNAIPNPKSAMGSKTSSYLKDTRIALIDGTSIQLEALYDDCKHLANALILPSLASGINESGRTVLHTASSWETSGEINASLVTSASALPELDHESPLAALTLPLCSLFLRLGAWRTMSTDDEGMCPAFIALQRGYISIAFDMLSAAANRTPANASGSGNILLETLFSKHTTVSVPVNIRSLLYMPAIHRLYAEEEYLKEICDDSESSPHMTANMGKLIFALSRLDSLWKSLKECNFMRLIQVMYSTAGNSLDSVIRARQVLLHLGIPFSQMGLTSSLTSMPSSTSSSSSYTSSGGNNNRVVPTNFFAKSFENVGPESIRKLVSMHCVSKLKEILVDWSQLRTNNKQRSRIEETLLLFHRPGLSFVDFGIFGLKRGYAERMRRAKANGAGAGAGAGNGNGNGTGAAAPGTNAPRRNSTTSSSSAFQMNFASYSNLGSPLVDVNVNSIDGRNLLQRQLQLETMLQYGYMPQASSAVTQNFPPEDRAFAFLESTLINWKLDRNALKEALSLSYFVLEIARWVVIARSLVSMTDSQSIYMSSDPNPPTTSWKKVTTTSSSIAPTGIPPPTDTLPDHERRKHPLEIFHLRVKNARENELRLRQIETSIPFSSSNRNRGAFLANISTTSSLTKEGLSTFFKIGREVSSRFGDLKDIVVDGITIILHLTDMVMVPSNSMKHLWDRAKLQHARVPDKDVSDEEASEIEGSSEQIDSKAPITGLTATELDTLVDTLRKICIQDIINGMEKDDNSGGFCNAVDSRNADEREIQLEYLSDLANMLVSALDSNHGTDGDDNNSTDDHDHDHNVNTNVNMTLSNNDVKTDWKEGSSSFSMSNQEARFIDAMVCGDASSSLGMSEDKENKNQQREQNVASTSTHLHADTNSEDYPKVGKTSKALQDEVKDGMKSNLAQAYQALNSLAWLIRIAGGIYKFRSLYSTSDGGVGMTHKRFFSFNPILAICTPPGLSQLSLQRVLVARVKRGVNTTLPLDPATSGELSVPSTPVPTLPVCPPQRILPRSPSAKGAAALGAKMKKGRRFNEASCRDAFWLQAPTAESNDRLKCLKFLLSSGGGLFGLIPPVHESSLPRIGEKSNKKLTANDDNDNDNSLGNIGSHRKMEQPKAGHDEKDDANRMFSPFVLASVFGGDALLAEMLEFASDFPALHTCQQHSALVWHVLMAYPSTTSSLAPESEVNPIDGLYDVRQTPSKNARRSKSTAQSKVLSHERCLRSLLDRHFPVVKPDGAHLSCTDLAVMKRLPPSLVLAIRYREAHIEERNLNYRRRRTQGLGLFGGESDGWNEQVDDDTDEEEERTRGDDTFIITDSIARLVRILALSMLDPQCSEKTISDLISSYVALDRFAKYIMGIEVDISEVFSDDLLHSDLQIHSSFLSPYLSSLHKRGGGRDVTSKLETFILQTEGGDANQDTIPLLIMHNAASNFISSLLSFFPTMASRRPTCPVWQAVCKLVRQLQQIPVLQSPSPLQMNKRLSSSSTPSSALRPGKRGQSRHKEGMLSSFLQLTLVSGNRLLFDKIFSETLSYFQLENSGILQNNNTDQSHRNIDAADSNPVDISNYNIPLIADSKADFFLTLILYACFYKRSLALDRLLTIYHEICHSNDDGEMDERILHGKNALINRDAYFPPLVKACTPFEVAIRVSSDACIFRLVAAGAELPWQLLTSSIFKGRLSEVQTAYLIKYFADTALHRRASAARRNESFQSLVSRFSAGGGNNNMSPTLTPLSSPAGIKNSKNITGKNMGGYVNGGGKGGGGGGTFEEEESGFYFEEEDITSPAHTMSSTAESQNRADRLSELLNKSLPESDSEETILHVCSRRGFAQAVSMLLSLGADTEAVDSSGFTPLRSSIASGQARVTRVFGAHAAAHVPVNYISLFFAKKLGGGDVLAAAARIKQNVRLMLLRRGKNKSFSSSSSSSSSS